MRYLFSYYENIYLLKLPQIFIELKICKSFGTPVSVSVCVQMCEAVSRRQTFQRCAVESQLLCCVACCGLKAALSSLENIKQDTRRVRTTSLQPRDRVVHADPLIRKRPSSRDRHVCIIRVHTHSRDRQTHMHTS